ncbi:hypothetical protein E2C01_014019 [Portunus trituberculatus]|uniref:Uncharacterized protein n=1 Tax=Portunus trituberculatus TaxID=210409 RepID=A0A5B7DIS0_PORTR|nr:hypothetical protein [Portunus trituberculatus]
MTSTRIVRRLELVEAAPPHCVRSKTVGTNVAQSEQQRLPPQDMRASRFAVAGRSSRGSLGSSRDQEFPITSRKLTLTCALCAACVLCSPTTIITIIVIAKRFMALISLSRGGCVQPTMREGFLPRRESSLRGTRAGHPCTASGRHSILPVRSASRETKLCLEIMRC